MLAADVVVLTSCCVDAAICSIGMLEICCWFVHSCKVNELLTLLLKGPFGLVLTVMVSWSRLRVALLPSRFVDEFLCCYPLLIS